MTNQDIFLSLIEQCSSLADEQKERIAAAVMAGRMDMDMQEELSIAFEREASVLGNRIDVLEQTAATAEKMIAEEDAQSAPEQEAAMTSHRREIDEVVVATADAAGRIERKIATDIEGVAQDDDAQDADAIRAMLKQKKAA